MGPDTEVPKQDWIRKNKIDTPDSLRWMANRLGAKLIDVRFTFQPNGSVLLARGLIVEALTKEQLDMIVEWRVSDVQPGMRVGEWVEVRNAQFVANVERVEELSKEIANSELAKANAGLDRAISNIVNHPERREPKGISSAEASKYPHYFKDVRHLNYVDIYRLLDLFEITDQPVAHAIKKLMAAGKRGAKDGEQDVTEAIDTLLRWKKMRLEDTRAK